MGRHSRHPRYLTRILLSAVAALALLLAVGVGATAYGQEMDPEQHLRVAITGEPPTLDPHLSSWDTSINILVNVFEGPVKLDKDLNVVPAVAVEVPSIENGGVSPDGKTYTFRLRDDVKYSDGVQVRAQDFEYALKRTLDPTLAAEYASFYYDVVGAEEYNSSKETDSARLQELRDAVGIKALDDLTFEVNLRNARASFLAVATMWPMFPVREEIVAASSTSERPDAWADVPTLIGNGPFKIAEWSHQERIVLVPNEYYYGPAPKLQKITLSIMPDIQAAYASYLSGENDIANVPAALIDSVRSDPVLGQQFNRVPLLSTQSAQFNNSVAPFDNPKVRRAFSMAIDRDALTGAVLRGLPLPAYSWIPPGMPGHQPELGKEYGFNPARARQILAEAGYPDGKGLPNISFQFANAGNNPAVTQFLQEQWKQNLGVEVTLEPIEPRSYMQLINRRQFVIGLTGWGADYPDPDNWLPELFGTDAGNNKVGYSNRYLDNLMRWANSETDPATRLEMWADAQRIVVDDAPHAFLIHQAVARMVKPYVQDIYFTSMESTAVYGARAYHQIWIAKKD